ncbi:hypothetical protein G7076_10690 [Sphingomonas sp. HDW15A]|uniref:hypothetical protein n=1 Tax=Sphingomonas sp. HDW15A TaxID=2714942 RepID=UPI00140AB6B2|nr:hypothetical protein [Sphingomonas sp. HDW15A]QIK96831.1 hypothetical protein G7076_10690 [Sphingomonas sp. HDW15A]
MKVEKRYRKHTPLGPKVAGVVRVTFCVALTGYSLIRLIEGLRTGQVEVPIRAAHWVVTSATPVWFVVVLLIHGLFAMVLAAASYGFGKKLLEDLRT